MKIVVALGALLTVITAAPQAVGAVDLSVHCGSFPLSYGTTIGAVRTVHEKPRISSVVAVAAITARADYIHARAWMVWDARGVGWLGLSRESPADLKRLWGFPKPPDFTGLTRQVRFSVLTKPLPESYQLTYCPVIVPGAP